MQKEIVPFFRPNITAQDKKRVLKALGSPWLTGGPKAAEFEKLFANYVGTEYAVAVNNCTAALHLALRALNIGDGDAVIVPALTFAATANAPLFCGATPIFTDIDEKTFNISPKDILKRITTSTKAIVVVHYAGQPCDMNEITQIAQEHNLFVLEDCAHSLGASYSGKQTGSIGTAGCFSFYPTKNITTLEGGMITTNDKDISHKANILRSHGMTRDAWERKDATTWYYDVIDLGYNYRLNEVQAALGISQLSRINKINEQRIKWAHHYTKELAGIKGIELPFEAKDRTHLYHLYVIRIIESEFGISRDELFNQLSKRGIGLGVHYTPLHLLTYYKKKLKYKLGDYPVAERISKEILSLPLYPTMSRAQVDYVVKQIEEIANNC